MVKEKRVSVVNKDGTVGWKMCEITTLACPLVNPGRMCVTSSNDCLSDERAGAITNKRARIILNEVNDQSELRPRVMKEEEDLPLDSNKEHMGAD